MDFEAYSAAALNEGKYVWAGLPRLDPRVGREGGACGHRRAHAQASVASSHSDVSSAMKRLRGAKAFRLPGLTRREREPEPEPRAAV